MKKMSILLMFLSVLIIGCAQSEVQEQQISAQDTQEDNEGESITVKDENTEITVAVEGGSTVKAEIKTDLENVPAVAAEDWCVTGQTYAYESEGSSVDSVIEGEVTYKGGSFCKASTTAVISSPAGDITSETVYYFDQAYNEFWILTSTSSALMPQPQTTEIHLVNGEIAN